MTPNLRKEQFSVAVVRAIAAAAGVKVLHTEVDDDSIDISLERSGGCAPKLDLQLKCTANTLPADGNIPFALKRKNFDDLRRPTVVPRFLVVLFVPPDHADWLTITPPDEILLRHCAWWRSLAGEPDVENDTSVTVHLPRANLLTPTEINREFDRIETLFRPI